MITLVVFFSNCLRDFEEYLVVSQPRLFALGPFQSEASRLRYESIFPNVSDILAVGSATWDIGCFCLQVVTDVRGFLERELKPYEIEKREDINSHKFT